MEMPDTTIPAAVQLGDYGTYTVKIYNDTTDFNIFPVLATPTNDADEWLQAAFQVPRGKLNELTFAHEFQYRMYIKPRVGIAPGQHVILTLPLCSQLVAAPDGTKPDEYIDWWNGGRVYLYDSPISAGAPPMLIKNFDIDQSNIVIPLTPGPACRGCPVPNPPIYKSAVALPPDDPARLTEYTVGAIDKGDVYRIVPNLKIVDYYVDDAARSAATGAAGNPRIGRVGSIDAAPEFRVVIG